MPIVRELRESDPLFLDTHALIWLFEGSEELDKSVIDCIESARESDSLLVSAISFWEIAMLQKKNRLALTVDVSDLAKRIPVCPLSVSVLLESCQLAELEQHGDPADRMIVASAISENSILLTRDKMLLKIAKNSSELKAYAI